MTTQAASFTSHIGMQAIKEVYKKNLLKAVITATALHLAIIGVYYLVGYLAEEEEPTMTVRIMKYTDLGPPPSITNTEAAPQVAVSVPVTKPSVGVPVTTEVLAYWPIWATPVSVQRVEAPGASSVTGQVMLPSRLSTSTMLVSVTLPVLVMR